MAKGMGAHGFSITWDKMNWHRTRRQYIHTGHRWKQSGAGKTIVPAHKGKEQVA